MCELSHFGSVSTTRTDVLTFFYLILITHSYFDTPIHSFSFMFSSFIQSYIHSFIQNLNTQNKLKINQNVIK